MIEIHIGNVYSSLKNCPQPVINGLRTILRYENDFFQRQAAQRHIPRWTCLITQKGRFLTGLLNEVANHLTENNFAFSVVDKRTKVDLPDKKYIKMVLNESYFKPRKYQREALIQGLKNNRGIFNIATGGGKTLVMAFLIALWDRKTLIVCQSTELAQQLRQEIAEYTGYDEDEIGFIGESRFNPKKITVALVQSLNLSRKGKKKKEQFKNYLESIEGIFIDEVHNAQAPRYQQLLKSCKNAYLRYGFTATAMTSKVRSEDGGKVDRDILLKAYIGPILYKKSTLDLIEDGYLAKPTIYLHKNKFDLDGDQIFDYQFEYERRIMKNDARNEFIAELIAKYYEEDKQVIGFVTRIDHGNIISDLLINKHGIPPTEINYVYGDGLDKRVRKKRIQDFKDKNCKILLGTVLNEGLNFFCFAGINISAGESEKLAIQRLGRILRKERDPVTNDVRLDTVSFVEYHDFLDRGHPYFSKHGSLRKKTYKKEGHEIKEVEFKV